MFLRIYSEIRVGFSAVAAILRFFLNFVLLDDEQDSVTESTQLSGNYFFSLDFVE